MTEAGKRFDGVLTPLDRKHIKASWSMLSRSEKVANFDWCSRLYCELGIMTSMVLVRMFADYDEAYRFFKAMKPSVASDYRSSRDDWMSR